MKKSIDLMVNGEEFDFPIALEQIDNETFAGAYGGEMYRGSYCFVAEKIGFAIMHGLCLKGLIEVE